MPSRFTHVVQIRMSWVIFLRVYHIFLIHSPTYRGMHPFTVSSTLLNFLLPTRLVKTSVLTPHAKFYNGLYLDTFCLLQKQHKRIELYLLLGWRVLGKACHESSNVVAPQSTPTPPQGTVGNANATSSSVAFTKTTLFFPDYRIDMCMLYKSWEKTKKYKGESKNHL